MKFTHEDLIKEVEREVAVRRNFYPKMVKRRIMTQELANKRIAVMEAVRDRLLHAPFTLEPDSGGASS